MDQSSVTDVNKEINLRNLNLRKKQVTQMDLKNKEYFQKLTQSKRQRMQAVSVDADDEQGG